MTNMMKAIRLESFGGPEVLHYTDVERPLIQAHEVLVKVVAIGVNYADTARREGKYVVSTPLPFIPGAEVAGEVVAIGDDVKHVGVGDRIVALINDGAYAEYVAIPAMGVAKIPEGVTENEAVALPLQGQTAYHLLKTMGRIEQGDRVLVHAAAGGVGSLAVQLAKLFGAGTIIATASTKEKLAHAKSLGAHHGVNYTEQDWPEQVKELTDGKGVDIALEMVGGEIFNQTLTCLGYSGRLVIFGSASGEPADFNAAQLMRKNQAVIGFFLPVIMRDQALYQESFQQLLSYRAQGELQFTIEGVYPLAEAADVHRLLQGRKTIGKLILTP